jgi:phosphohistidine phosphatase
MELLVIRHAIAEDRDAFAKTRKPDAARPLTDEGRKKMRKVARGLREIVPAITVLASSPLIRARETADIVARAYGDVEVTTTPTLAPDQPPKGVAAWLEGRRADGTVAVVGHEPALSQLVGWLVSGEARSVIDLKKGAACLLDLPPGAAAATATLLWALTPAQLRALGD